MKSVCNNVNYSKQKKPYSLRKTKALSKKLKKVNILCSININFKNSNKCAVFEFVNWAHYKAFSIFSRNLIL